MIQDVTAEFHVSQSINKNLEFDSSNIKPMDPYNVKCMIHRATSDAWLLQDKFISSLANQTPNIVEGHKSFS